MRWPLILLFFVISGILFSCREPKTATSCPTLGNTPGHASGKAADGDPHFFRRKKRSKAEDGFRRKEKRRKEYGERAEKGKKKQRDLTKPEKKVGLFRRKKRGEADAQDQNKGVFKTNEKKRRKEIKKRIKHPQNDLFPGGKVGK